MNAAIRIGTRESELAVWQATLVQNLLKEVGYSSTLVYIKSDGDIDLKTPLYEMGVQGIFTKSLDIALLNNRIDIAVHSMKDVPTQLPEGITQAAVLKRGNWKDILVFKQDEPSKEEDVLFRYSLQSLQSKFNEFDLTIATSSIRRKAQWLHRYPNTKLENLRGNVNTRMNKLTGSEWDGAIFAAAGLERIGLRPAHSIDLDWMLPAPAQGAIVVACRKDDLNVVSACAKLNDPATAICTKIERDFLRALLGGCSTPISALAQMHNHELWFKGNIFSTDGKDKVEVEITIDANEANGLGERMAKELLEKGGQQIINQLNNAK